ncbi:Bifunctional protein GlmU [Fundidesulfovibrio magnetotacticus]|uniref:Bifunctional protein GlmU n=1 Tax=Fundidesulfovibrio magnetotacticus TaxID=2730080 RepID=A0A6V8LYA3_9BACT|nr:bifunctional UDP-N-acetylglucosamine diphosphorylase/glucosamine-1-phosphate N-acetyltransferase GlmU [Fundidesulfovibrio magnetotacticus]GFK95218.1 Bifunctional protein GlmU [Fundidesulfovibrio magnetotacticus]
MKEKVSALVLAAGKGTRMYSEDPKVLRTLLGEPMLGFVLGGLEPVFGERVRVVVGFGAEKVRKAYPGYDGRFVLQEQQLGTGHALQCAWSAILASGEDYVLVVNGDVPLASGQDLAAFVEDGLSAGVDLAFLTIELDDPGAYGRVVRDASGGACIVEAKDFDPSAHGRPTGEINAGIYLLRVSAVDKVLHGLTNANKGGEFYITDLAELVARAGGKVSALSRGRDENLLGINNARELLAAEESLRVRIVDGLIDSGVVIRQAGSVRVGPRVRIAPGCEVCGPCELLGDTLLEPGAVVESGCVVKDSQLGVRSVVHSFSHLERAVLGVGCHAGPFARLRPGAVLEDDARVGNFVEMKKSVLGPGAKAGHLSYLGDAFIGAGANIGAGTITCNYDGVNKHVTRIGAKAFIGSNTALVAPVTVGDEALVGAGSVITKEVPPGALAIARGKQIVRERRKNPA